ncbi:MAG TPA: hypothetical protein VK658_07865 [Chryseolinea sp.]|nr:hypothetical protein [Chryseolinea sp.]
MLTTAQIDAFITDGYVCLDHAFSSEVARQCRELLWKATGCNPRDPSTWTRPVVRIGEMAMTPFRNAANTRTLHEAFDQLVGPGNWIPRQSLGTFPIRFPSDTSANDTGWHVDASFPGEEPVNYQQWRINVVSRGRGLLMLFLFSDVDANDAPTRIRSGSHIDVAKLLAPHGETGLSFMDVARELSSLPDRTEATATGTAGTVYLCHPFVVHAAQDHQGTRPKFMAQPPLLTKHDFRVHAGTAQYPVEVAIFKAMEN